MALTTDEEAKVKLIIQAFDNAKQIGDLDLASMDTAGQYVELYDSLTGKASRMLLSDAVSQAGAEWCGIRYKDAKTETEVVGSLSMLRQLPTLLNLGGYLVQNDHSRRAYRPRRTCCWRLERQQPSMALWDIISGDGTNRSITKTTSLPVIPTRRYLSASVRASGTTIFLLAHAQLPVTPHTTVLHSR